MSILTPKRILSWLIISIALLGVALSYYAMWILVTYFAAGLVWYAEAALLISGPVAGIGAALAYKRPRQKLAMIFAFIGVTFWVLLWAIMFLVLGFRFQ